MTLADGNSNLLTVTADGAFAFVDQLPANATYAVTVLSPPAGTTCSVQNGNGTIDANDDSVSSVVVECISSTASLVGTVSGLQLGTSVTLSNAGVQLPLSYNGIFAFPATLAPGTPYDVTVATQPVGQTCTVVDPTGTIPPHAQANVTVSCN
jgi:hypothetical protein